MPQKCPISPQKKEKVLRECMVQNRDKRNFILLLIFWIVSVLVEAEKVQQGVIHILSKGGTVFRCFRLFSTAGSIASLLAEVSIRFSLSQVCWWFKWSLHYTEMIIVHCLSNIIFCVVKLLGICCWDGIKSKKKECKEDLEGIETLKPQWHFQWDNIL